jgi:hybrid cluster-associated redox disulfide protein
MHDPLLEDPDLPIADLLRRWPETMPVFIARGMLCVGCMVGPFHTIDDACSEYGIDPIFTAPELRWASAYLVEAPNVDRALHPTGDFSATSTGLLDLDGNVWEWTQDCYDGDIARTDPGSCPAFIMGGMHESVMFYLVCGPASGGCASGLPPAHLGFRLVTATRPDGAV